MFTGIITHIGTVAGLAKTGDWVFTIEAGGLDLAAKATGASISCAGACLTVIAKTDTTFDVQVSAETLDKTTLRQWRIGTRVNLEGALRMGDELGGHLVSGHVDGIARVTGRVQDRDSLRLTFEAPAALARYLAPKGSAVIDGVSLTVNRVDGASFDVNIIPHTQGATTLGTLQVGDAVNFEADMIARYLDRLLPNR